MKIHFQKLWGFFLKPYFTDSFQANFGQFSECWKACNSETLTDCLNGVKSQRPWGLQHNVVQDTQRNPGVGNLFTSLKSLLSPK